MSHEISLTIDEETWLELANLVDGVLAPLTGFMSGRDYRGVVDDMRLGDGSPWTIPVTLELPEARRAEVVAKGSVTLNNRCGEPVGELEVHDVFQTAGEEDLRKIYGTADQAHPGVRREAQRSRWRVGGPVRLLKPVPYAFPDLNLTPAQSRTLFASKGWKTVVGFQTRNPIHRAHEYLQRVGMEFADGIFVQPLIGWKKPDDFSPEAVVAAYRAMFQLFYPPEHGVLGLLTTPMRYAGPREAVFHALVRRNHGCTHFIVGRDHAGVGNFYGLYEAQELCSRFDDLGITILPLRGPYFCSKCDGIVTDKSCSHGDAHVASVSGTKLRSMLQQGVRPPEEFMRPEISEILIGLARENRLFNAQGDA